MKELTQLIRVADVIYIGPRILTAAKCPDLTEKQRKALVMIGWGTIIYNGIRFFQDLD